MIVKEGSLIIQNAVRVEEVIPHEEWFKPVLALRRYLVNEEIYYKSPVIFTVEDQEDDKQIGKYTYYIGLNMEIEIPGESDFTQEELLMVGPAIYVRCAEIEEIDKAYELLEEYAEDREWKLDPSFYHVTFDVFDEVVLDVYAKVEDGEGIEWS